jgi:probable phosphoglycerate mutase
VARLYVARHGETDWNRDGRYQGRRESSLTERGALQAGALAEALAGSGASRVVSSPLRRCIETAAPLARRLDFPVAPNALLVEIAHGTWEGRLRDEIALNDPHTYDAWRRAPETVTFEGGESLADAAARWARFAAVLDGEHTVVVVTHDVLVRLAILAASERPLSDFWKPHVENGGYAVLEGVAGKWRLIAECRNDHLHGIAADASRQAL